MVYTTVKTFAPNTHGVTAMTRPWIVAMVLVGAGTVLIEYEVGDNTDVWAKVAAPYTVDSPNHVVAVEKGRSRIRITPSNGATYEVTNE